VPDLASLRPTLDAVLDTLIPARGDGTPGAGRLGVGEHVIAKLGDAGALVADGLAALEAEGFAALDAEDRTARLERAAAETPGLIQSLVFHAYTGYYQHPRALEAIGLPPRPPWPEGYEHSTAGDDAEANDFASLVRVRERGRRYREA